MTADRKEELFKQMASDAARHAAQLREVSAWVVNLRSELQKLGDETTSYCRNFEVPGDRWFHPIKRSRRIKKDYRDLLNLLDRANLAISDCAQNRMEFDKSVEADKRERWEKKHGKGPIALPGNTGRTASNSKSETRRPPQTVFDLGKEESA